MSTTATDEAILAAAGRVTDPVRPLPFAFAKRHGVMVRDLAEDSADVVVRDGASPLALAEVRRHLRRPLKLERVNVERFDLLLREAYEAGYAPPVVLESTYARALDYVLMDWLRKKTVAPAGRPEPHD